MRHSFRFVITLPLLLLMTGCYGSFRGIQGSGISKTETREVGEFSSITHDTIGNVTVTIGEPQSVKVTVDDNLQSLIKAEVVEGTLVIKSSENFSSSLGAKIEITVAALAQVNLVGIGSMELREVDSDDLKISVSGVGSIKGTGSAKKLQLSVSGVGSAELKELKSESVDVSVSGVGSASVYATQLVDAKTSGIGNVTVLGNPQQHFSKSTGIGKITIKE